MKIQTSLLITSAALLSTGCVHTYTATSISRTAMLNTNHSALIALAEDGRFEKIPYPGSGRKTTLAVSGAFSKQLVHSDITPETGSLASALESARSRKFDYLIVPTVVHWEDRATEWSGRPDRIEIELRTVDAASGETLALGTVQGKSRWFTFGGDVPEDLLQVPINAYVNWLFTPVGTELPIPHQVEEPARPRSPKDRP